MGSLNTQIGAAVEAAFLTLLNRAAFGYTVSRRAWRSDSTVASFPAVVVKATDVKEDPCAPLYLCRVSLTAYTYSPDDEAQAALNSIHGDLEALATTTTAAALTALASNVTIHAIDVVGEQESAGDEVQSLSVELDVSVQAEFSSFTTSTTTSTTTTT